MFDPNVQTAWLIAGDSARYAAEGACHAVAAWRDAGLQQQRPCVLFKPRVFPDGNMWIALYGDNIHDGVVGTGKTADEACIDFDIQWLNGRCGVSRRVPDNQNEGEN